MSIQNDGRDLPTPATTTHCSACGRKIRKHTYSHYGPPNSMLTDYKNHLRDCRRYGMAPDRYIP